MLTCSALEVVHLGPVLADDPRGILAARAQVVGVQRVVELPRAGPVHGHADQQREGQLHGGR